MNNYLYLILIWIHSMGAGIWLGGSLLYFLKSTVYKDSNKPDFISEYNSILTVSTIILFATGILISSLHYSGLSMLTHTPSPMTFLNKILKRPNNEKPFVLLIVGLPKKNCEVPYFATQKKTIEQISTWI